MLGTVRAAAAIVGGNNERAWDTGCSRSATLGDPSPPQTGPPSRSVSRPPHTSDYLPMVSSAVASPSSQASSSMSPAPTKRPRRRIRPKIALDPEQPLTIQGKERARVYIACNQCRARKTRCDGAKPVCFHCRKRPPEDGGQCSYEPQLKRRGRDKAPRSRTDRPSKRRRASAEEGHTDSAASGESRSSSQERSSSPQLRPTTSSPEDSPDEHTVEYDPFVLASDMVIELPAVAAVAHSASAKQKNEKQTIPARPSLQFTRQTWWDALLTFYSSEEGIPSPDITGEKRSKAMRRIVSDLRGLFQSSLYWLSFIHLPRFFDMLFKPARRATMQPSLLLSALAVGTLAQSSEIEEGAPGRMRALKLLEMADSALQASFTSGWVDYGLVQAAWLIVYFEIQAHPLQSAERCRSSLLLLDSLMRLFSLTTIDADLKCARPTGQPHQAFEQNTFAPTPGLSSSAPLEDGLPHVAAAHNNPLPPSAFGTDPLTNSTFAPPLDPFEAISQQPPNPAHLTPGLTPPPTVSSCNCAELTIARHWPSVQGLAPSWGGTPMWPNGLSEGEFQKEECRRLVWSSVMLTASLNAYTSSTEEIGLSRLSIKDPRNYAILFPGESLALTGSLVPANDMWTLHLRSMLLLHSCTQTRDDPRLSDSQRAEAAMSAWLEIDAIEQALDQHTCGIENHLNYQAREMLFSSRMCVSQEFHRYIPQATTRLFYRDKAESWLKHRVDTAQLMWDQTMKGGDIPAKECCKPLVIYWLMSYIIKAIVLWRADPTLTFALTSSKTFARRAEHLMIFWPSPEQRREWQDLRYQLVQACLQAGVPPPEASIPAPFPRRNTTPG
ncbi:hypothetical protein BV20DRAFT_972889 [Pilatotrama ljubarskyi]|nr:hypothetical protein BV20DRAFT_972889 [Pilatotrama ljubarskyi]